MRYDPTLCVCKLYIRPLSKKLRRVLIILPVRGATAAASDVGVMSGIHNIAILKINPGYIK